VAVSFDYLSMDCSQWREVHSARLDGEATALEAASLDAHLDQCEPCRTATGHVEHQHRATRVVAAEVVPDLSSSIAAAARATRIDRGLHRMALRAALGVVAALLVLAVAPELLLLTRETGDGIYHLRHLGGWDLAYGVALGFVALQPWRARGLLPMAVLIGVVMAGTTISDLATAASPGMSQVQHLLEFAGLLCLWRLARIERLGWDPVGSRTQRQPVADRHRVHIEGPALRVVGDPPPGHDVDDDRRSGTTG
jgi:predicted anti-sigma-YlaC factor YlaD